MLARRVAEARPGEDWEIVGSNAAFLELRQHRVKVLEVTTGCYTIEVTRLTGRPACIPVAGTHLWVSTLEILELLIARLRELPPAPVLPPDEEPDTIRPTKRSGPRKVVR